MIVTVEEGLSSAIDEVAEAAEPSRRFLRRAWFQAAVSAFSSAKPMTIVGRRASGRALIAVPVVAIRRHLPFLRTVPGSYWPFRSIAVSHDLGADDLVAFLGDPLARKALGFIWRLGPIATTDPIVSLLRTAAHSGGWYIATKRLAMAYVLDLQQLRQDGGWPRGTTVRKNRAHERHLAEHGALDWIRISGRDWTTGVVEMLAGIEERSWVGVRTDRSESQFLADGNGSFWREAIKDPLFAGHLSALVLRAGGRPVAFSFDLNSGPVKYAIANCYDPEFSRCSPGKIVLYRNLTDAMAQGLGRVDLGAGDSGYKGTIGAEEGGELIDLLLLRRSSALLIRPLASVWSRGGSPQSGSVAGSRHAGR